MDGQFYLDSRAPFLTGDIAAVTLATTNKALYPVSNFPVLGGQYWNYVGKKMKIELFGRFSSATAAANLQFSVLYGNGGDANGTTLASSGTVAQTTSQVNISWNAVVEITCRSIGSTGTLFCVGWAQFNPAVIASTLQPMMIPASAPVVSAAIDLTTANIISVQALSSVITGAPSMQIHDMSVISYN
jgi:hypothetical protein